VKRGALAAAAALAAALAAGCNVDNHLEDEIGQPIPVALGILACADAADIDFYGYAVTETGSVGDLAGSFSAPGFACADFVQRPEPGGPVLVTPVPTTPDPSDPDVVELSADGTFVRNYDSAAPLRTPAGITTAADGTAIVADLAGGAYRFDAGGAFQGELAPGFAFEETHDVLATSGGEVLVLDYPGAPRVYRFTLSAAADGTYTLLGEFPDETRLDVPLTIAEDDDGTLLVGDAGGGIVRFDAAGAWAGDFTTAALGAIASIVFLPGGNVVVLDLGDPGQEPPWPGGVLELSADGTVQRVLAPPIWTGGLDAIGLVADVTLHGISSATF
jgi:hypothetical protein